MSYLTRFINRSVPQREPLRADQTANSAGRFVWEIDRWTRLRRFLILGSEGGSFYAGERELTRENAAALDECIADDGARTVAEILAVSTAGRAAKNDPAVFALAAGGGAGDQATRRLRSTRCRRCAARRRTCSSSSTFVEGVPRLGPRAAPCRRRVVRAHSRPTGWRTRRSSTASATASPTATCCGSPTRPRGDRRQPDAATSRPSTRACSSGSSAAATPTGCRAWSRASPARRPRTSPARVGRARPRVRPAARGASSPSTCRRRRSGRRCSRACR